MTDKPLVGAALSDLHIGSRWGLWPEGFTIPGGNTWNLNRGQGYLLECYTDYVSRLPKLDFLLLGGDLLDGQAPKEKGIYQMTTDVETQAEAAIALLDPLCSRAKAIYCVKGTRYHEAPETTERLARELGAVRNPAGFYAAPTWAIEAGGLYIDTWHKLSDAQIYTAQSMQREAMFSRMMAEVKGYSADLILAGHWHSYRAYEDGKTTVLTTPCWELQTPWAEEGKPNLWLPGLGGLVIYLWPGNREKGLRPITWDRVLYPLPKREVSHLAIRGNKTKRESAGA